MRSKKTNIFSIFLLINFLLIYIMPCHNSFGFAVKNMELLQDQDYYPEVMRLINGAQNSINVCMFQAVVYPAHPDSPSNRLLHGLIDAHKRGVKVEVVLDNGGSLDEVASSNTQTACLLKKAGIEVFFDSEQVTTHTKFLVIDNSIAVLGSTNWTFHALAKNHELSAVVFSSEAAQRMNVFFGTIRKGGKRF
jgi:phosphatidylserine/phosphatidylglycerophosphate/cardiolipin synthase-like enzyme